MQIDVLPKHGIGPEIAAANASVLRAASERFDLNTRLEEQAVGHASLQQFGATVRLVFFEMEWGCTSRLRCGSRSGGS
jgi:3-isopropylmalate dehydrogenase